MAVDTQEAMGANMVNTMMEALVPELENLSEGQSLMAILSNLATKSLVTATCRLNTRFLSRNKAKAHNFAKKMELASQLAQVEQLRLGATPMLAKTEAIVAYRHGPIIKKLRNWWEN